MKAFVWIPLSLWLASLFISQDKVLKVTAGESAETATAVAFHTLTLDGIDLGQINYDVTPTEGGPSYRIQLSPENRSAILNDQTVEIPVAGSKLKVIIVLVDAPPPPPRPTRRR